MKDLRKTTMEHLLEGDLPSKKYVSDWVLNS